MYENPCLTFFIDEVAHVLIQFTICSCIGIKSSLIWGICYNIDLWLMVKDYSFLKIFFSFWPAQRCSELIPKYIVALLLLREPYVVPRIWAGIDQNPFPSQSISLAHIFQAFNLTVSLLINKTKWDGKQPTSTFMALFMCLFLKAKQGQTFVVSDLWLPRWNILLQLCSPQITKILLYTHKNNQILRALVFI